MEELKDGIVLEFLWTTEDYNGEIVTKENYMVYVNQKLTKEDIDDIEDRVSAYMEDIGCGDPKQLIHDILGAAGYSHQIVDFYCVQRPFAF